MSQEDFKKNKKKKTVRSSLKYPALNKDYNLRLRTDYTEPEYVDGVRDEKGNLVIRPLNEEEKKWLNDFYEEAVNSNFLHDKELRKLHEKRAELSKIKKPTEEQLLEYDYVSNQFFSRANEVLLYPDEKDQKKIYGENNARNRCLYNRAKSSGRLRSLDSSRYDDEIYGDVENAKVYYDNSELKRKSKKENK